MQVKDRPKFQRQPRLPSLIEQEIVKEAASQARAYISRLVNPSIEGAKFFTFHWMPTNLKPQNGHEAYLIHQAVEFVWAEYEERKVRRG